jgi:hypothetical protein
LSQHGVVISELRVNPGPTHSVFDVLAALIARLPIQGRLGALGFAGGGMMAPLAHLGFAGILDCVDLDTESYQLFCQHCPQWTRHVRFETADAEAWLRKQRGGFALILEDLSVPWQKDVKKPDISWTTLPPWIPKRLAPGGLAVFNLLKPKSGHWNPDLSQLASHFREARVVYLDEFENRILVAGDDVPPARALTLLIRTALQSMKSRQATRFHVRTLE